MDFGTYNYRLLEPLYSSDACGADRDESATRMGDFSRFNRCFITNKSGNILMKRAYIQDDLINQIIEPVRWIKTMDTISSIDSPIYEIGSGKILSKFIESSSGTPVTSLESIDVPT